VHKTYLLTGPLLSSAAIARTQLTAERLKAQEDEKSLAKLSATQKIRVVELDEVSDGERNSEDGDVGDDGMGMYLVTCSTL
jgi:DNA polymerase delta subunit 3